MIGGFLFLSAACIHAADPLIRLETVVTGLTEPVFVTHAGDGTGRLFILEQRGRIRVLKSGRLLPAPFLDITRLVDSGGEKGLLGLAFHPDFKSNGRFFVNYTRSSGAPLRTVIAEYKVAPSDADAADPAERVLMEITQPFANHNGGMIAFGPDGYLYIGMGDGGSGGDPFNNGQRTDTLLGKLLRIDVDGASPYAVPKGNPFADRPGFRGEIWAYGLRNPWRFSFDRLTGRLFLGDVGQNEVEEVDLIVRGENYGWNIMEGSRCYPRPSGCDRDGLSLPIAEYGRSEGISITGGYVYRGGQETSLKGAYIFGDFGSSRVWSLVETGAGTWKRAEILRPGFNISSFGQDEQGELYIVNYSGGSIHRMLFGSTQVFPQIPDGGGYATTFTLTNASAFTSQTALRFFDPDGAPRRITLAGIGTDSTFPLEIPAGGTRVVQTDGAGGTATAGMTLLDAVPAVGAVATFRLSSGGQLNAMAAVPGSGSSARVRLPVLTGSRSNVAIAVANPGAAPVHVRFTLLGRDGAAAQSVDLPQLNPLAPRSQVALLATQMGFQGGDNLSDNSLQVLVQGEGEVGVLGLLLEDGLISSLPVIAGAR